MKDKYYINIGKAPDVKNRKERIIYRALEIMPGFLVWLTLIGMVVLSWLKPTIIAYFIITFCVYWLLRTVYFSACLMGAYKKMEENLKINWAERLRQKKNWEDIYHLIIFPIYKEGMDIVGESFQSLVDSKYPKDKMIVVLATEKRAGSSAVKISRKIQKKFGNKFYKFLITEHPQDIQGELAGKGSNETWAIKQAKEKIIDPLQIPYHKIIVSCFDSDTQVFPDYFSVLTYHFLDEKNPHQASYQPIPLYLNNVQGAPFFSRVVSSCNVFWQMIQQQRPEKIVTYSSHSMSFKALDEIGFWQTNVVSEDAGIFWKSFLFYDGDYKIVPLHYPISMDTCLADSLRQTIIEQYKQQLRWAWGSEGIPYLLFGFYKNKAIPFAKKFHYGFLIIEGCWAWATNALILLFLGWLPIMLGNEEFKGTMLSYNLPNLTGDIMTVALVGVVVFVVVNSLLMRAKPFYWSQWKNLFIITQWIFLPVSLVVFGSIPAIHAQTRLMLGKYMGFHVTAKARKV